MADPITPLTPQQLAQQEAQASKESLPHQELVNVDIAVDSTILFGPADMTISTRMGLWALRPSGIRRHIGRGMCRVLDLFESNHDAKAAAGDIERAQNLQNIENQSGVFKK